MINNQKNKGKNILKTILSMFEIILTIAVMVICAIIIIQRVSDNEKGLFGYRLFKIETGSMIPKYQINDVILVKEVDIEKIQVGDDLVYEGKSGDYNGLIVTHQLIRKEVELGQLKFYTKGLANATTDPAVLPEQVVGVVQNKMYILTFIVNLLLNGYSIYFLIVLPITLYIFFKEIHSNDRKEEYIQKRIKEKEEERKREEAKKTSMVKRKRGQLIINTESNTRKRRTNDKKKKS